MLKNKYLSASILAALVSVGIWGCGTDKETTTTTAAPLTEFNKTMTLQGKIINATTGAPIGGADLKVYLVQGTANRTPDKLITDTNDPLVGEYAFSGIPVSLNNSIAYKVVAINTGYQRFEGECLFDYDFATAIDTTYNWIGNIYLFPVGTPAGDLTIYVKNSVGTAVSGATVLLRQNINTNTATNGTTTVTTTLPGGTIASTTLTATNSLLQSLSGTTDSAGKVTFAGTTLALGANYTPIVLPLTFDGQQLSVKAGTAVTLGSGNAAQQISMTDLEPTANLFYVVSASNSISGSIQSTGALALTFNRKIAFDSNGATSFTATATAGTLAATSATAAISTDGYTLTLTPSWTTAPLATDAGATVTFAGGAGSIVIQGYTGTSYTPLSLLDINGAAISTTVKMIAN